MQRTLIDWCDYTWNPITGCLHGCDYCYARSIARRFSGVGHLLTDDLPSHIKRNGKGYELSERCKHPYPFAFEPTFHMYRLAEPMYKAPGKVFVGSMADLFGEWVPRQWIDGVISAALDAQQHRYLFLTKNPKRYVELYQNCQLTVGNNYWYGKTICTQNDANFNNVPDGLNTFVSIEPILEFIDLRRCETDWVIVGAETGNRRGKVFPNQGWIFEIERHCAEKGVPLFMKKSMIPIMGEVFVKKYQQYPEGLK
jgi:protein gp37